MDASQITKLLQIQNTRYINRNQTVDSSTLTWKNQIQSSKYIKGVKTCDGQQNCNVPTNPCCPDRVLVNGELQNTGINSFGGSGRTTAIQTGSPQQFLNVLAGSSGSGGQIYSSETITLQKAGKESCGVTSSTQPDYPANSYIVLPGGSPAGSNAQLQNPSCSYLCTNTNGPVNGQDVPINNNLNPYLPAFDTYYKFKNPSAQCRNCPDQNQKHFLLKCNQCPTETPIAGFINTNPYTIPPVPGYNPSISYPTIPPCPTDLDTDTYSVAFGTGTPAGGVFSLQIFDPLLPPPNAPLPGPFSNPATVDSITGAFTIPGPGSINPSGLYIITYTVGTEFWQVAIDLQGC
jgi:hypothetical protein